MAFIYYNLIVIFEAEAWWRKAKYSAWPKAAALLCARFGKWRRSVRARNNVIAAPAAINGTWRSCAWPEKLRGARLRLMARVAANGIKLPSK